MPLIKRRSKEAFEGNVKSEMAAGKPQKQALAIAFNVKRHAGSKKYRGGQVDDYAAGGAVHEPVEELNSDDDPDELEDFLSDNDDDEMLMAEGGEINIEPLERPGYMTIDDPDKEPVEGEEREASIGAKSDRMKRIFANIRMKHAGK